MRRLWSFVLLGLVFLFPISCRAALWGGSDASDAWDFIFTPTFYSGDLEGDLKINGQKQSFQQTNPFNFVSNAMRIRGEAWKGKWGVLGNVRYLTLWDEANLNNGSTLGFNAHYWGIEAAGSYRYLQTGLGTSAHSDLGLELYLGARSALLSTDLDYSSGQSQSFNKNVIEPLIGHRIIYGLGDQWNFVVRADIGGTSSSNMTWDISPEVVFLMTEGIYLNAGYEVFHLESKTDKAGSTHELNAQTSGPTMGLTFRF